MSLIVGLLAVVPAACVNPQDRVEYIASDRAVIPMKQGDPAPADGWFVPPAVMQEIVPCLDEQFRESAPFQPSTDHDRFE